MSADLTPTLPVKTPGGYTVIGNLEELLDAIVTKLQAGTLITARGIKVMPQHSGDLYNHMNLVINRKLSCLMVVALEEVNSRAMGISPTFREVIITVLCYESVMFNQAETGSKVSALTLAELACKLLHHQALGDGTLPYIFMTEDNTLGVHPKESKPESGQVCYFARFKVDACPKDALASAT